ERDCFNLIHFTTKYTIDRENLLDSDFGVARELILFTAIMGVRDLRFDNVPFGRTAFAPTLWTKSVTVGAQSLRPPIDWDIILTQVPKFFCYIFG
ncbi:MAG: hypothetical protein ACKO8H_14635, partial [Microcystis panniformis]